MVLHLERNKENWSTSMKKKKENGTLIYIPNIIIIINVMSMPGSTEFS